MARVRLGGWDGQAEDPPPVCALCDAEATAFRMRRFAWFPSWVCVLLPLGLVPFVIVALAMTKRMWVRIPFCAAHARHYWRRVLPMVGAASVVVGLLVVGFEFREQDRAISWPCFIGAVLGFFIWAVLVVFLKMTEIRPTNITERSITLTGVSPAFADAVEEETDRARRFGRDFDREAEERWDPNRARRRDDREEPGRYREGRGDYRQDEAPDER